MALVIAGVFYVTPSEKCTRHWATSGVLIAVGVLLAVLNAGAPRYLVLVIYNNCLILGLIYQWLGIRAFYRKPRSYTGWAIGIVFFVTYGIQLLRHAPVDHRALLSSATIALMLALNFREIWTGQPRRSFASTLALVALGLLLTGYSFRFFAILFKLAELMATTNTTLSVTVLYLVPIIGIMLFSSALLLLYFERVVADKHYLATHDELTGMLNRRALVAGGEREVAVANRTRRPLAVAYVDIDHFKQINDKLGHETGDRVITEVAAVLKQVCRSIDLFGRYGGEEFCIVFPGVGRDGIAVIGERLISAVRAHRFDGDMPVTISVGLSALSNTDGDCSWTGLIRQADEQLYKAKATGRNRYSAAA